MKNNILTIENYVERYLPIQFIKLMRELLYQVFEEKQMIKFLKVSGDTYFEMQKAILQDQGSGSIFKNIMNINEYISERLKQKIDLTRVDQLAEKISDANTSKMEKMAIHLIEKTEDQVNEENMRKKQGETREELMATLASKFRETEYDMTLRLTKMVSDMNKQKDLISSTLELSQG